VGFEPTHSHSQGGGVNHRLTGVPSRKIYITWIRCVINCLMNYGTEYNITSWLFDNKPLLINQTSRFNQNASGLVINNVTKLNGGNYTCYVDQLWAVINVHIE